MNVAAQFSWQVIMVDRPAQLGLRERNKLDKLKRIKQAALELFVENGFDDTTIREIAAGAAVGMGTVFLYADNKRDLLFLIANDELAAIADEAAAGFRADGAVLTNLMKTFRPHYAYFSQRPRLSRDMLREMMFYESGKQASRFQQTRERLVDLMTDIFVAGQRRGEIVQAQQPTLIAWVAFSIYQVELRRWLSADNPDVTLGAKRLEKALSLLLNGVRER